ncbi:MAG TPA: alpha/beta hydrolase domain-containing protein [Stellaceae bacterium]|nr:alpha/beta hydrolase domain-containing protein [Stellaceae bacterium]
MVGIKLRIDAVEPFAEGRSWGETGPYERVRGVVLGTLDPAAAQNRVIVDLDKAPRNEAGLVEYESDFFMLRPVRPRSAGLLVYDVTNRGNKRILAMLDDGPADGNDPKTARDAGIGFSLGRGYTILWSGWDPGAPTANNGLGARFPMALAQGRPVPGVIRHEFHIGTRTPNKGDLVRLPYPAAAPDRTKARLAVRARESDARQEIPAEGWEFADAQSIRLLPHGTVFAPYKIYELWYEAAEARVLGTGFAAVRDLVAALRYERADLVGGIAHALAFGVSQSGRFLRHFLELGMNEDGRGRRIFDGVLTHVAGAGKVFANHRFGMPGRTATQHEDRLYPENWFPFSHAMMTDPFSGRTDAILKGRASDPLVIEVNSATEYWQKGASLVHTDPLGRSDAGLPPNVRVYMIAGTQHGGRPGADPSPGPCANPRNPVSATPALRALFRALEEWTTKGVAPPPSRVPMIADGTAVRAEEVRMPAIPGFAVAPGANPIVPPVDWVDPPARLDTCYGARVAAVDADGNEITGIRLPPVAVPLGTHTGWNVYREEPCELCDRDGSFVPFARTRAERARTGDPRPSLAERYGDRAGYVAQVEAAAAALVAARLLLPEDMRAYVEAARACGRF